MIQQSKHRRKKLRCYEWGWHQVHPPLDREITPITNYVKPPPTRPPRGRPRKEKRIRVGEVRQQQLLANRVGKNPSWLSSSLPASLFLRGLATTQLPTLNLTPNTKFSFLHACFLVSYILWQYREGKRRKTLFIRLFFDLIRFLWHWWDTVALEG